MCIRITEFNVIPNEVREGDEVTLVCNYDTEGGQLYSLKWYREESEFFRLEPNSNHSRLLFRVKGIKVDVSTFVCLFFIQFYSLSLINKLNFSDFILTAR